MPDFTMCADSHDCPKARDCRRSIANTEPSRVQSWALFYGNGRCRNFMPALVKFTPPRYDGDVLRMLDTIEDD